MRPGSTPRPVAPFSGRSLTMEKPRPTQRPNLLSATTLPRSLSSSLKDSLSAIGFQLPAASPVAAPPMAPAYKSSPLQSTDVQWGEENGIEPGVGHTARWTAALRVMENDRPDALFKDPLARAFAGESALELWKSECNALESGQPNARSHIAIRARALDDIITEEIENLLPADSVQVVSLGAGMCTRPWRLEPPDTEVIWFEVDKPDSIRSKVKTASQQAIKPSVGTYHAIGLDFADPRASLTAVLQDRGFNPRIPTIFVMEGLLYYLAVPDLETMAEEINEMTEGKLRIVMTAINDGFYRQLRKPSAEVDTHYPGTKELGKIFHSSWEDGIQQVFEKAGFHLVSIISREDYAQNILHVEMLNYPFPDRRTSTEYIIVMRRPDRGFFGFYGFLDALGLNVTC